MKEIQSFKALEQAITDGEPTIMLTSDRVLTACIMAERCGFDKADIGKYVGLVQAAQKDKYIRRDPDYSIRLQNDQGKPYKTYASITILANAIRVIQILDNLHSRIILHKDDNENFTGVADITT